MQIQKAKISNLISPQWNPRQITSEELEKLETSLKEFGYIEPIIVNDVNNHIVGGNQRYKVLKSLEYEEIDVVYIHEEDLNREKALNIALNKINGEWDTTKLTEILNELGESELNVDLTGFDEFEIKDIELYDEDYEKDEFDNLIEEYTIKHESDKNESWFYVEFYEETEKYDELVQYLKPYLNNGVHEIDADFFYNLITGKLIRDDANEI